MLARLPVAAERRCELPFQRSVVDGVGAARGEHPVAAAQVSQTYSDGHAVGAGQTAEYPARLARWNRGVAQVDARHVRCFGFLPAVDLVGCKRSAARQRALLELRLKLRARNTD